MMKNEASILGSDTFIQCDLQYFNLPLLRNTLNYSFDVIVCDPPWRIKGQKQDSSQMFSNNPFKHTYNTMCNQDILNL